MITTHIYMHTFPPPRLVDVCLTHAAIFSSRLLLRDGYMTASFPLVYRRGKDIHCIVGVLGSLTTRYDSVITLNGKGWSFSCLNGTPRPQASLLCEINYASLTNKYLIAPAVCTVPDPSPRPSFFHNFFQYDPPHDEPGDFNQYTY